MGRSNQRRRALLAQHPSCCFCGVAPTEEPDHVPPKAAFFAREWPEEFEFPSCALCNRGTRLTDQYFSWHVRMFGWDDEQRAQDERNTSSLLTGIRNNQPHLLPGSMPCSKEWSLLTKHNLWGTDTRLVRLPREVIGELEKMYRKMAVAFYYRHTGCILPSSAAVSATVDWNARLRPIEHAISLFKNFPRAVKPMRNGRDFLGQFIYSWDVSADGSLFGFAAKFSSAALGMAVCYLKPEDIPAEERTRVKLFRPNGNAQPESSQTFPPAAPAPPSLPPR